MQYKTIVLELVQERPDLYNHLRSSKTLLQETDRYAVELKTSHEALMQQIARNRPGSHPSQLSSEAMELAVTNLRESLAVPSSSSG